MPPPYCIEVLWVNAHADRDVAQHGIGYDPRIAKSIYLLNDKADDLANIAAAAHEIDEQLAKQQLDLEAQTEQVLKRMVAAAMLAAADLGQLPKRQPPPEHPRFSLAERLAHCERYTTHRVIRMSSRALHCMDCFSRSSVEPAKQLVWLGQICTLDLTPQKFGAKPHPSHRLHQREQDGLVWCRLCGMWSTRIYKGLKQVCDEHPRTGLQRLALGRLAKGLSPPGVDFEAGVLLQQLPTELEVVDD